MKYVDQRITIAVNFTAQNPYWNQKLDSIHREDIWIFTCAFRISPVEAMHIEAKVSLKEQRRNELGFLYKLRSNATCYMKEKREIEEKYLLLPPL